MISFSIISIIHSVSKFWERGRISKHILTERNPWGKCLIKFKMNKQNASSNHLCNLKTIQKIKRWAFLKVIGLTVYSNHYKSLHYQIITSNFTFENHYLFQKTLINFQRTD